MTVQLLVSVRSVQEAAAALAGGADIIDIKEPSHGSLGAAAPDVIDEITQFVRRSSSATILSAAMGEVGAHLPNETDTAAVPARVTGHLDFLKCGLSGLQSGNDTVSWKQSWTRFRNRCSHPDTRCRWVAVSYADFERSRSPAPIEVLEEGKAVGSPILLIDTFTKDGTTLVDWLTKTQLHELRAATNAAGMKLALAGRINAELLPEISEYAPDIIAIRGAACERGDRGATVTAERVRVFRTQLTILLPVA